jgi:hypothetical protein
LPLSANWVEFREIRSNGHVITAMFEVFAINPGMSDRMRIEQDVSAERGEGVVELSPTRSAIYRLLYSLGLHQCNPHALTTMLYAHQPSPFRPTLFRSDAPDKCIRPRSIKLSPFNISRCMFINKCSWLIFYVRILRIFLLYYQDIMFVALNHFHENHIYPRTINLTRYKKKKVSYLPSEIFSSNARK